MHASGCEGFNTGQTHNNQLWVWYHTKPRTTCTMQAVRQGVFNNSNITTVVKLTANFINLSNNLARSISCQD